MEKLSYAAILLFVFGIVQTHSYPQAHGFSSLESVENSINDAPSSYLDTINFDGDLGDSQDGGRVKRERKLEMSELLERAYKRDRIASAGIRASNIDAATRDFHLAHQRFETIVDNFIAQGHSLTEALDLFERRYPRLARQIVGYQENRNDRD